MPILRCFVSKIFTYRNTRNVTSSFLTSTMDSYASINILESLGYFNSCGERPLSGLSVTSHCEMAGDGDSDRIKLLDDTGSPGKSQSRRADSSSSFELQDFEHSDIGAHKRSTTSLGYPPPTPRHGKGTSNEMGKAPPDIMSECCLGRCMTRC